MEEEKAGQELDEQTLIARAAGGDRDALSPLLYAHYERLLQRIRRNLPPDVQGVIDAEDVVQQAHIKAFQGIAGFRPQEQPSFYYWLAKIADNTLVDEVKKQRRQKRGGGRRAADAAANGLASSAAALLDVLAVHEQTPSRSANRHDAARAVQVALAGLEERQRQALSLVYLEGLSLDEAAARMQATKEAVRSLAYRELKALREAMGSMSNYLSRR